MPSALIVHSRHTKKYALSVAKKYSDVSFIEVKKPPTRSTLKIMHDKDIVVGIGGGSVIDTAKIISGKKRCVAIPTTAAGAAMTPYATVWGRKKASVSTGRPVVKIEKSFLKHLPAKVLRSTMSDALSHAIESFWSKNATSNSRRYSKRAFSLLNRYINGRNAEKNIALLVKAGNAAGQAIAITKTNVVHAISYPITINYHIDHGSACGMVLPYVIEYMDVRKLPAMFRLKSTGQIVSLLRRFLASPSLKVFDVEKIASQAMRYDKINDGPRRVEKHALIGLLSRMKKELQKIAEKRSGS